MRNKRLRALGLHGHKTFITVKTMNGEVTKSSEVLDGIEVAQASPVDNKEIATAEKLKKQKYLDKLKPVISVDDNQEVSLLIGANCVRALEPREVISSQNGGAYAFQTLSGLG